MISLDTNSFAKETLLKQNHTTPRNDRSVFIINAATILGGAVGGIVGFVLLGGPLGALAGSIAGIAIARFCGEVAKSLQLKSQSPRSFNVNFRSIGKEDFIKKFFPEKRGDLPRERETIGLDQIANDTGRQRTLSKNVQALDLALPTNEERSKPDAEYLDLARETDSKRYITNITANEIEEIIRKDPQKEIRENILFANCQNLEISVARAINCQYDSTRYSVMQLCANDKDSTKSTLQMNEKTRTTTLICKLQVYDTKESKVTEKFEATAVMDWDTANTSIKTTAIN